MLDILKGNVKLFNGKKDTYNI